MDGLLKIGGNSKTVQQNVTNKHGEGLTEPNDLYCQAQP